MEVTEASKITTSRSSDQEKVQNYRKDWQMMPRWGSFLLGCKLHQDRDCYSVREWVPHIGIQYTLLNGQ